VPEQARDGAAVTRLVDNRCQASASENGPISVWARGAGLRPAPALDEERIRGAWRAQPSIGRFSWNSPDPRIDQECTPLEKVVLGHLPTIVIARSY
jgi:hypothetical protein